MYGVGYSAVESFHYLYPPVTVLAFVPFLAVGELAGYLLHTAGTVLVGAALAWLVVRYVDGSLWDDGAATSPEAAADADGTTPVALTRLDAVLVGGYVLASVHAMPSTLFGQVNTHIAAAFGAGVVALDRDRGGAAGVAFGLAGFLKVFPAAVGVWLLRRRAWRAVVGAVATAGVGFALGLLAFGPGTTRSYVETVLLGQSRSAAFAGGVALEASYTTLLRPLSVVAPELDPAVMTLLAAGLLAPVVAVTYRRQTTRLDRLVAVYVTLVATLLVLPSYPIYYAYTFFPQVACCYLLTGRPRRLFLLGVAVTNLPVGLASLRTYGPGVVGGVTDPLLATVDGPLTLASVHLYGLLVTLLACVVYEREREENGPPVESE
nr:glycosyltransferase family 87 protein [Halomarina rubra]